MILLYILLIISFLIFPFGTFVIAFILLFNKKTNEKLQTFCLIIIALFWSLLAFSQKSIALEETDCIRYYEGYKIYQYLTPWMALKALDFSAYLTFVFTPISVLFITITKNVQVVSFVWVFISYMFTYLSIRILMKHLECYTRKNFATLILILTFCFMHFVQISELLKNASAFAIFFYAFSCYLVNGWNGASIFWFLISIGIHSSVLMMFPLFFYKLFKTKYLLVIALILIPIFSNTNIFGYLFNLLPNNTYFQLLNNRYEWYTSYGQSGTLHYIAIQFAMLSLSVYLWIKSKRQIDYVSNIVLIYFIISLFNYTNLVAYLRLSIFSHWMFGIMLAYFIALKGLHFDKYMKGIIVFMLFMTIRWTVVRTIPGGYSSSYMDNSITNIIFSSTYEYLSVKYDE